MEYYCRLSNVPAVQCCIKSSETFAGIQVKPQGIVQLIVRHARRIDRNPVTIKNVFRLLLESKLNHIESPCWHYGLTNLTTCEFKIVV